MKRVNAKEIKEAVETVNQNMDHISKSIRNNSIKIALRCLCQSSLNLLEHLDKLEADWKSLCQDIAHMDRKISHGCTDAHCPICDGERPA